MKKLMIAAACAAMAGSVFAAMGDAQVYDATLTVKTTACKTGKYTRALVNFPVKDANEFDYEVGDEVMYRKQATRTIKGVFWGCDCETIGDPHWRVYTAFSKKGVEKTPHTVGGYAFWDATDGKEYIPFTIPYVTFEWLILNRIDQMTSVEGTWLLRDQAADEAMFFMGAGFGTANNASDECASYIKTISGNFAGYLQYAAAGDDGCVFCGTTDYDCLVAPFCWCQDIEQDTTYLTAAFGTWTISYNASNSNKLKKKAYITEVPDYAKAPFKAHTPSVYDSMLAQMVAVKTAWGLIDTSINGDWDDYIVQYPSYKNNGANTLNYYTEKKVKKEWVEDVGTVEFKSYSKANKKAYKDENGKWVAKAKGDPFYYYNDTVPTGFDYVLQNEKKSPWLLVQITWNLKNDELLEKTLDTYLGELDLADPGKAVDSEDFPDNAKKYLDAS
jgi:hypothetical protein